MVLRWLGTSRSPGEAADLLLANLDGGQAVAARLDAAPEQRHAPAQAVGTTPEPVDAYLQSLTVSGFRGIGRIDEVHRQCRSWVVQSMCI
jgi:hypothetical protein